MKYALIPINRRIAEDGTRIVRRVLISYKRKTKKGIYKGTKLIEVDPYFNNPKSSQQYVFTDKYFYLVSNAYWDNALQNSLKDIRRPYKYDAGLLKEKAIEFEAPSNFHAIKMFNSYEFNF